MNKSPFLRTLLTSSVVLASACVSSASFADTFPVTVTDVAGRTVTIEQQPQHVALSTGRVFPLLEIIYQQDAADHLVAWRDDMRLSAPSMYANYIKDYPELAEAMKIGKIKSGEFDAERFINMDNKPDVFVVDISNIALAREKGLLDKLETAGIKVIAIDFREDPIKNTVKSVTSLAKALGREDQGEAFADYYQQHVKAIEQTVANLPNSESSKTVFIERAAGYDGSCCQTFATGNMGAYIPFLKATNIADKPLKGAITGKMSPESVIAARPDVYIMQTTGWIDKKGNATAGIPLGYSPINEEAISKATQSLMGRSWLEAVNGYQSKDVYSIYMPFYNSPYNLVAMEYFAKWIHPDQFASLDPEKTFEEMNLRFANRQASGTFGQNNFEAISKGASESKGAAK
ncbi:ABC transporter substrate-binding protein [Photobacterium sp. BZF1]|uniref:ABC transporter substrate-binding protein n=1 Tax=Photobacterium sp. BZF1 TaxID=1904457 RepID=UPI001653B6AE|nr:ABC transporter substrate-binding protein [Photobacterium sp. BZF1]MBC7001026.1 ABC transporter substrate-binding protein [Photobacterium sp. BZF1]